MRGGGEVVVVEGDEGREGWGDGVKGARPCSHKRAAASFYKIPLPLIDSAGAPERKCKRLDFCGNTKRTCGGSGWRLAGGGVVGQVWLQAEGQTGGAAAKSTKPQEQQRQPPRMWSGQSGAGR